MKTTDETSVVDVRRRLGYLLKNAELRMAELNRVALAPLGIDGRELGVLMAIASEGPASQQEAGRHLNVDRTTMVAFVDSLEHKGLVSRHPDPRDRRRNIVELTDAGRTTLAKGVEASDKAESALLEPLGARAAQNLREALAAIVIDADR